MLIPHEESDFEYQNSQIMTNQLTNAIYNQQDNFIVDKQVQAEASKLVKERKGDKFESALENLKGSLPSDYMKLIDLAS